MAASLAAALLMHPAPLCDAQDKMDMLSGRSSSTESTRSASTSLDDAPVAEQRYSNRGPRTPVRSAAATKDDNPVKITPSFHVVSSYGDSVDDIGGAFNTPMVARTIPTYAYAGRSKAEWPPAPFMMSNGGFSELPIAPPAQKLQVDVGTPAFTTSRDGFDDTSLSTVAEHQLGRCKPCLFSETRSGCRNGPACQFCHWPHARKQRHRPSKSTRTQCKQLLALMNTFDVEQSTVNEVVSRLGPSSAYMNRLLQGQNSL